MITIQEIAALAGVSKSTVSRVLNKSGYVSQSVRSRVEQIITENNYSPSAMAVNLSRRETKTIGVLIPELDNVFFGEILKGITEVAEEGGFSVICCDTADSAIKEDRVLHSLAQQRVRGLIIAPAQEYTDPKDVKRLETCFSRLDVPIVVVDRHLDKMQLDGVYYENYESGYLAASELIKAGNRRLGIITGNLQLRIARDRYQGFRQAVLDAGLELDENFILKGDFGVSTAYRLTKEMLERGAIPEGIVTSNNRTSLGFLKAVREHKIKIGTDIAVIGIDNIDVLDMLGFDFSCVMRDVHEMGRLAAGQLFDRIENKSLPIKVHTVPCQLVLKGTERRRFK